MSELFAELSPRARAYLAAVGCARSAPIATSEAIAAMFDPPLDAELFARVTELEERYGGVVVDPAKANLQLGLGALAARSIPPETLDEPQQLVLVGIEEGADVLIDRRGWVWASTSDEPGEQAVSVEKYIEHMAALATDPWPVKHYTLFCDPRPDDVMRVLALGVDEAASDEVFTFALTDAYQLIAQRLGTTWLTSRSRLRCRDFAALHGALALLHAQLPDLCCAIASGHPSWAASRAPRTHGPQLQELQADLLGRSAACIPAPPPGGAIHLLRDGGIEAYTLSDRGLLANHHQLTSSGGQYREFFGPPPS